MPELAKYGNGFSSLGTHIPSQPQLGVHRFSVFSARTGQRARDAHETFLATQPSREPMTARQSSIVSLHRPSRQRRTRPANKLDGFQEQISRQRSWPPRRNSRRIRKASSSESSTNKMRKNDGLIFHASFNGVMAHQLSLVSKLRSVLAPPKDRQFIDAPVHRQLKSKVTRTFCLPGSDSGGTAIKWLKWLSAPTSMRVACGRSRIDCS